MLLPPNMAFSAGDAKSRTLTREVGNVQADSDLTFPFALTDFFTTTKELPFQVPCLSGVCVVCVVVCCVCMCVPSGAI